MKAADSSVESTSKTNAGKEKQKKRRQFGQILEQLSKQSRAGARRQSDLRWSSTSLWRGLRELAAYSGPWFLTLPLQQQVQHVWTWCPHAWVSKWFKTGFYVILSNRISLQKIMRKGEMTDNEISLGSTKAVLLCGNFMRYSIITWPICEMSNGSALMSSLLL